MLVPGSSTIASILYAAIRRRAFSMRDRRSSSEIGTTPGMERVLRSRPPWAALSSGAPAARGIALRRCRRFTMGVHGNKLNMRQFSYGYNQRTTLSHMGVPAVINAVLLLILMAYINAKFDGGSAKFEPINKRFDDLR